MGCGVEFECCVVEEYLAVNALLQANIFFIGHVPERFVVLYLFEGVEIEALFLAGEDH